MPRSSRLRIRRVYEEPEEADGKRILVDRVWPRGLTRDRAAIDLWLKEIAPSSELRRWFGHDPEKWPEFRRRYHAELRAQPETVARLRSEIREGKATLLFGAKDEQHNNARALLEYLQA